MSLFVIADTHLSLNNSKPMDIFGSRWSGHVEKLRMSWSSIVGENDTVVIAGDISWAMTLEKAREDLAFIDSLPGKKILIRGNHDYWWSTPTRIGDFFEKNDISSISILQNSAIKCEDFVLCGTRGWYSDEASCKEDADFKKVAAREALRLDMSINDAKKRNLEGEIIAFTHFPIVFGDFVSEEMLSVLKKHSVKRAFFGHIHGRYSLPQRQIYSSTEFSLVSADFLDFRPQIILPKNQT